MCKSERRNRLLADPLIRNSLDTWYPRHKRQETVARNVLLPGLQVRQGYRDSEMIEGKRRIDKGVYSDILLFMP